MIADDSIAVAHDQMWILGGAERVALHLAAALDAPLFTTHVGEAAAEAASNLGVDVRPFASEKYSGLGRWRRFEGFKSASLTLDWQTAPLDDYDLIVSAHMFSRHYRTLDHQYMLNYCHSPPRWLNDLQRHRLDGLPAPARPFAKAYMTGMDVIDARSADRVDAFVANSEVIRDRIRRYYRRDATVVYPPIDTTGITAGESTGDYYLMVGRVVEAKRPRTVVEAFAGTDRRLLVAGDADNDPLLGKNTLESVKEDADDTVEFLGYVSDVRKQELLREARAVVYVPVREDFGMVPIEALAAGTPVVAAAEGFPEIAIDDGETGVVVEPTVEGIRAGLDRIERTTFDHEELAAAAADYATDRFYDEIRTAVDRFRAAPEAFRRGDRTDLLPTDGRDTEP